MQIHFHFQAYDCHLNLQQSSIGWIDTSVRSDSVCIGLSPIPSAVKRICLIVGLFIAYLLKRRGFVLLAVVTVFLHLR